MQSQFSPCGRYFAQLNAEGKLNVWSVADGALQQEFTPDYHLTLPCSCLYFHRPKTQENSGVPRKRAKRSGDGFGEDRILLGTNSGDLLVYSVARGGPEFDVKSGTGCPISCLSCDEERVYSGANNFVIGWDLKNRTVCSKWNSGPEKITSILCIAKRKQLLTAARTIKVWDIVTKQILKSFTGHRSEVDMLHVVDSFSGKYVVSGSKDDRLISCWNLEQEREACANFLVDEAPVGISIANCREEGVYIAVVTKSGAVNIYIHFLNGKIIKPVKPKTTVQIASDDESLVTPIPIVQAVFTDKKELTIAYGCSVSLTFENIIISDAKKLNCLIRKRPETLSKEKDARKSKLRTAVRNDGAVNYVKPQINGVAVKRKDGGSGCFEIPMEKRLQNLTLNKPEGGSRVPKNDNVAQLLLQALQSKDKSLLKNVLSKKDPSIVGNTVKRLPMKAIAPLICELDNLMQGKTVLSDIAVVWLHSVIQIHTGLLLSNPELFEMFRGILGTIENRLSLHRPLSKLSGKLDLLISQVSSSPPTPEDNSENLLIFNDKDTDEDSEVNFPQLLDDENEAEWMDEESSEIDEHNSDVDNDDDSIST